MKICDIQKLKASGESLDRKRSFLMPLVYFNGAKESLFKFSRKVKEFELERDWLVRDIKEINAFCSANEGKELTPEVVSYIDQWPEGRRLDVHGAMEEIHSSLAESLSHYFNFLTHCVASVESCTNQEIAKLLYSGALNEGEVENWKPIGIGHRPRHLLERKEKSELEDSEIESALAIFQKTVICRNNFVHYKTMPVTFTCSQIDIANVVGDQNANMEFCSVALDSVRQILNRLSAEGRYMTFETAVLGFQSLRSPSPYMSFH